MKKLIQTLQDIKPSDFGSVLFVGAGKGDLLPVLRGLNAEQMVLCEANPVNLQALVRIVYGENETLLPIAASTINTDCVDFHILNNVRYSSSATPAKIIEIRPNLRIDKTVSVPAKSLTQIIHSLSVSPEKPSLLILDAQGCNHALMRSIPISLLYSFEWLLVSGMQIQDAYKDDCPITETTRYLKDYGFELIMVDPEAIHPNANALFKRLPLVTHVLAQEEQNNLLAASLEDANRFAIEQEAALELTRRKNDELEQRLMSLQTRIETLIRSRDEHAQLANERASQLESLNQAKSSADKLAAERQAQLQQVSQERDAQTQQLTESQAQLTHRQQKLSELEQQLKERQTKIESMIHTRDDQLRVISQQAQRITQLETEQSEMDARQNLLNEEMIRAEAQIDLIKDVLLREPGLRE